MMDSEMLLQSLAIVAGAIAYVGYFKRGEHHMNGVTYIKVHTITFAVLTALLSRIGFTWSEAFMQTILYDSLFFGGLFASLFLFRAFFNPLNIYPGPWLARITSFLMPMSIQKMQMYKTLERFHGKYGHFVRIGTNELSITHPQAIPDIFGAESVCEKGPWYDISRPQDSLLLRRSFAGHGELRSVWSHAFSIKACRGYEDRIQIYRNKFLAGIDDHAGKAVDVNHWLGLYSWDVLSDLSFGHPFGMLDAKDRHWAMNILDKGMSVIGPHLPMWFLRVMIAIPGGKEDMKVMLKYCQEEMLSRWKTEPKQPDVMTALFAPYKSGEKTFDSAAVNLLAGEAHLLVNAGSDTTRVTMACALFVLTKQPELAQRLREAIAPHVSKSLEDEILDEQISTIDLLNGVISESLRMWPPSPSHPTRVTPPEGAMIAGKFIPGRTQLMAPAYVIGRNEDVFPRANEFIPERWYSSPELIKDRNATAPFSLGPMNCIGKPIAMANVRVTLARIVMRYNLSFAPGQENPVVDFEEGMCEHFSLQPGPLLLRMEKRD